MDVRLIHSTGLYVADEAISKCWDKQSTSVTHMIERMERVGVKNKHSSTLEHVNYTFDIDGISRACLQELARHRHASLSVKSTRYTLKELMSPGANLRDFIVEVNPRVDSANEEQLRRLLVALNEGLSNDIAKYMLPEAFKTSLVWTINMRALRNFIDLRTSRAALAEIRELAFNILDAIPAEHQFMFEDVIHERS
jgi:thymidylate synthase (FAD)